MKVRWESVAALSLPLGALVAGCATSSTVQMPDGSTAYDVQCFSGRWSCSTEAKAVCNGGPYVVLDEDETLGMVTRDRQGSMRVQCAGEYLSAQRPEASAEAVVPTVKRSDVIVCGKAYGDIARTAPLWSAARGREARDALPAAEEFMKTCTALPERAQLCLNMVYREHHETLCDQTMSHLGDEAKGRLDALFLMPPGAHVKPAAPGGAEL